MTPAIRQLNPRWDWGDGDIDMADISDGPDGWRVSGRHGDTMFWLSTDPNFVTQWVDIRTPDDRLYLKRGPSGWEDTDSRVIPDSLFALDPDIACTAFTNTVPIRRLGLADGAAADVQILYIAVPELTAKVVTQSYRREGDIWHYHNYDSGFQAALTVDRDGLVTDYPGVCTRIDGP